MNEIKIVVTSEDLANAALDRTAAKSKATAKGVQDDFDKAGKSSSEFKRLVTDNMQRGETAFEAAGRAADELRGKVAHLREELKTGDGDHTIFADLQGAEADLRKLEGFLSAMEPEVKSKARKLGKSAGDGFIEGIPFAGPAAMALGKAFVRLFEAVAPDVGAEAAKLGEKAGKALADGVASAGDAVAQDAPMLFTPEGAAGAAILAAVGLTLAPALGAAVAAAIDGAIGLGFVGLGAYLLKDEPSVRAAAKKLKDDVLGEFTGAATDELAGPFEAAMAKLDGFFASGESHVHDLFAAAGQEVAPIEKMFESIVKAIGPALVDDVRTFTQILDDPKFQSDVQGLAENFASFFETVAHHKGEIEVTLQAVMGLASVLLGVLNVLINIGGFLSKPLEWADQFTGAIGPAERAADAISGVAGAVMQGGQAAASAGSSYDELAAKLNATAVTADTLAGAMADKLFNSIMGTQKATLAYWEASTRLDEAIKQNGRTVDITTAKGQANTEAILAAVQANINLYDQQIRVGISAKDAAAAYQANTDALERHLLKLGIAPGKVHALIDAYKKVPPEVDTDIALHGLTDAINDLDHLLRLIYHINDTPVSVIVNPVGAHGPVGRTARASGGISGGLTWVGERGAELVRLPQGSTVYPAGQSAAMAAAAGGGGPMQLSVTVPPSTDGALAQLINSLIRTGQIRLSVRDSTTGRVQAVTVSGG